MRIKLGNQEFDFTDVVNLMDDALRESLHDDFHARLGTSADFDAVEAQVFVDEYCARHLAAFGEPFAVN